MAAPGEASPAFEVGVLENSDFFSAMRATLSSDRSREHLEAQARDETVVANALRAEDVVRYVRRSVGDAAWIEGMHPELSADEEIPNPYLYAGWDGGDQKVKTQA